MSTHTRQQLEAMDDAEIEAALVEATGSEVNQVLVAAILQAQESKLTTHRQVARWIEGTIGRETGRRYQLGLEGMSLGALRDLQRLLRDLEHGKQAAARKAAMEPWRGW